MTLSGLIRTKAPLAGLLLLLANFVMADDHPVSMWLIEGESNRIYLLGSVHLLRKQDHPLPAVMEAAYDDAEALIMELDMDDLDAVALQAATNRMGLLNDGRSLRDLMGDDLYEQAEIAAEAIDIPFDLLSKSEPWFAAITIEQLVLMRIGFNPLYGIELHMTMKATQDGKPIEGLETAEEQLAFFDNMSLDAQNELLMQTLTEGQDVEATMDSMIDAWRIGDVEYLRTTMLEEMAESQELYKTIVVDRNRRWVGAITDLLDDSDDYLIVVGALHLVGEEGVPALLSERGIRAEQMNESF